MIRRERIIVWSFFVISIFLNSSTLPQISFQIISFQDFEEMTQKTSDQIRIYNFWATWCAPCIKEMPYFEKVSSENDQLDLIFISLDDASKSDRVVNFIENRNIQAPVYLLDDVDYNKWIDKVSTEWSGAIPATLFVQPNGTRTFHEGELEEEELKKLIANLK